MSRNVSEVKSTNSEEETNTYLERGWVLLDAGRFVDEDGSTYVRFIIGKPRP